MIQFNDRKNATHELSLSVHDSGPGWNVWLATVEGDTRYFEAADDVEVWDLIDLAVHCYDEEVIETVAETLDRFPGLDIEKLAGMSYLEGKPSNRSNNVVERMEANLIGQKEAFARIASRDLSEMNAPKIEYPALYRKLLSPEEFTD